MEELKSCPFCGGEADLDWGSVTDIGPSSRQSGWVTCTNQNCDTSIEITSIDDDKNSEDLVNKWNTRVEAEQVTQLEKEKAELLGLLRHLVDPHNEKEDIIHIIGKAEALLERME